MSIGPFLIAVLYLIWNNSIAAVNRSEVLPLSDARVIFQGDSITDANRDKRKRKNLYGNGYVFVITALLSRRYPSLGVFFSNQGIGGSSIQDVEPRWQWDCLDLQPTVISIFFGVDSILLQKDFNMTSYGETLERIISKAVQNNSNIKIVINEPFVIFNSTGRYQHHSESVSNNVIKLQKLVLSIAFKHSAFLVQYHTFIDSAHGLEMQGLISRDGVHPLHTGARLMADQWIKVVFGRDFVVPRRTHDNVPLKKLLTSNISAREGRAAHVMFEGDSITDCDRDRRGGERFSLGNGYAYLIAGDLGRYFTEREIHFSNAATSGATVANLSARWMHVIHAKPKVLSILVGVNDVWNSFKSAGPCNHTAFELTYANLLELTRSSLPSTKIIIGEPFVGSDLPTHFHPTEFNASLLVVRNIVVKLGARFNLPVIRYQAMFDAACAMAPAMHCFYDGIHPTPAGHQLMAEEWVNAVLRAWG